jgi:hypothetical protein
MRSAPRYKALFSRVCPLGASVEDERLFAHDGALALPIGCPGAYLPSTMSA